MLLTEQVKLQTIDFLKMSAREIVKSKNSEDETIGKVVQQPLPEITSAVELITERLNHGGRLLHFGAGTEWTCGNFGRVRVSSDFRQALGNGARHYRRSRNSGG